MNPGSSSFPVSPSSIRVRSRGEGFTLVEVLLALGLLSFAIVSMVGLISVGLTGMQSNIQRTVEAQIMDWSRNAAKVAQAEGALPSLSLKNPYRFDAAGLHLESEAQSAIYSATLTPVQKPLPGSDQSLWGVEVVISAPAQGNRTLGTNALWFRN